ncbi:MAG: hypothetical protein HYV29_02960 [Ignavibacteriales bacterium]|nr:hypothetical protein [Ignavibacteriales bacterium]
MANKLFGILFCVCTLVSAGDKKITGNIEWDLRNVLQDTVVQRNVVSGYNERHQNPFYNSLYSLVIPGTGQYHSERYTKAAIFLGTEVALIAYAIISENNGDKKTEEFQKYAEAHWSAERYARWIEAHGKADYGPTSVTFTESDFAAIRNNYDFSKINEWEQGAHSEGFSHQLPRFREQQYYELIGKYHQFKFGWSDYPKDANQVPLSDNGQYDNYFDAEDQVNAYATERARANDYYYAASFAASVIVINHVLSALDAYVSTKSFNNEISATLGLRPVDSYEGKRLLSELKVSVLR